MTIEWAETSYPLKVKCSDNVRFEACDSVDEFPILFSEKNFHGILCYYY
jgi:hypothetical protein